MKKIFLLAAVLIFVLALAGCNVAPNTPGVTPYVTNGAPASPYGNNLYRGYGNNTRGFFGNRGAYGTYGNYSGYGQGRGMLGNNVNGGTYGTGGTGGTTGTYGTNGRGGTYGTGTNANGSKGVMTPTGRMNHLMNARSYTNVNPGDKDAFPGGR
jgi:hypothetical protein